MKGASFSSSAKWESKVGYSRARKMSNVVEVSGTVALMDGMPFGIGDPYAQAKRALEIIGEALEHFGGSYENVIRTRMYVTDIAYFDEVGRAHSEVFGDIRPATSLLEVSAFASPEFLVEIEATAILK